MALIGVERGAGRGLEIVRALRAAGAEAVRSLHAEPRRGVALRRGQILRMRRQRRDKQRGGQKARPTEAQCCVRTHVIRSLPVFVSRIGTGGIEPLLLEKFVNSHAVSRPDGRRRRIYKGRALLATLTCFSHAISDSYRGRIAAGALSLRRDRPILRRPADASKTRVNALVGASKTRVNALAGAWDTGGLRTAMGAKHFGARITRLEDPALLTGRGRFVDDIELPGVLHAAFVRSPHAHARIREIDTQAARGDGRRSCRADRRRHAAAHRHRHDPDAGAESGDQDAAHADCARPRRGLLRRPDRRGGRRGQPLRRGRRRRRRRHRLRAAAGGERRARRGEARRAGRARRSQVQRRGLRADDLWRRRRRVQQRAACVRDRVRHASRRGDDARRPRGAGELRRGGRHAQRLVGDADAASVPRHARRPVRAQSGIDPRHRARWSAAASAPRRRSIPRRR